MTPTSSSLATPTRVGLAATAALLLPALAGAQTPGQGFQFAGSVDLSSYCGQFPVFDGFDDGSLLVFDGRSVERRSADGLTLRTYASFPTPVFASFIVMTADETQAYFGESSTGSIRSLDLVSGQVRHVATIPFNFDLALDVVPGLAYVSAPGTATLNAVWGVDLVGGQVTELVALDGYSGPLAVDAQGDLFAGVLDGTFPPTPDASRIVRFGAAQLTGGALLLEGDGFPHAVGFDNLSSLAYDAQQGGLFAAETNTGTSGFESVIWQLDAAGQRAAQVATAPDFASGLEFVDSGGGTDFGPYQPAFTSLRFSFSDCFGSGEWRRWNVTPARPVAVFAGPGLGQSGGASIDVTGGVPNGFASLWIARTGAFEAVPVIANIGGLHPVALQAQAAAFGRRLPLLPLDAQGAAFIGYTQDVAIEGALLFQWIVFDGQSSAVTSSTYAVNQDLF